MVRFTFVLGALLIAFNGISQSEGNYIIVINNDSISIDMNGEIDYETSNGENLRLKIIQPEMLTYSDDMISFSHHKSLNVSTTELDRNIEQCVIIKSTGNGFMVQEYHTIDPSSLVDLMLNELTKESVSYGYSKTEKKFKKKVRTGQTLEGIQATLKYNGEKEVYTVATYGEKDQGVLVVTMMLNNDFKEDQEIIELFLNTLSLNF